MITEQYVCSNVECGWQTIEFSEEKLPKVSKDMTCPKCNSKVYKAVNIFDLVSGYTRDDPRIGRIEVSSHWRHRSSHLKEL